MFGSTFRSYLPLIIFVGLFCALFHAAAFNHILPWQLTYSDIFGFFDLVKTPGFPYIDKNIEYPVLTGLFVHFTGIIGQSREGYYILSAFLLIILGILSAYFLYKLDKSESHKKLLLYWILAPSMFVFWVFNWDIIAILFVVLAFYCASKEKDYWAAFFLGLGFCAKFYPALYLIPLLLKHRNFKDWIKIIAVFSAVVLAINLPFMIINFDGWYYFYSLNSTRSPNFDSIWTTIRFLIPYMDNISRINFVSFLFFALSYFVAIWKLRKESFLKLCFIATILFLLFNKVFTPQYVLWLLPFFVLFPFSPKGWFYSFEFSNIIILFITLSWFFLSKDNIYFYWSIPFVFLRHISLIAVLLKVIKTNTIVRH